MCMAVQKICGQAFDVQMGSDDNRVMSLKQKIKKPEGTSGGCQDLVLIDEEISRRQELQLNYSHRW